MDFLKKREVIKAIERKNPDFIPGCYSWFAKETYSKYGKDLIKVQGNYIDDLIFFDYTLPENFIESEEGKDEFYICCADKPDVFRKLSNLQHDWLKIEKLISNSPDPYSKDSFNSVKILRKKYPDSYLAGCWHATFFERLTSLRGEDFLNDLYLERTEVEKLGWMLCDFFCDIVDCFSEVKMDGIFFSDDLGLPTSVAFDPALFRKIFKPWYKKLFEKIKQKNMHVMMHSCGCLWEIIPDLIDCGLDVLHFQPSVMDIKRLVKEFGKDLTFFGGIDVNNFLSKSTPEQVTSGILEMFKIMDRKNCGFISGPSNLIMPDTPFENIVAMLDAMKKFSDRDFLNKVKFFDYFNQKSFINN